MRVIWPGSTMSCSAAIWRRAVFAPWPSSHLPVMTVSVPSAPTRIQASSQGVAFRDPGSGGAFMSAPPCDSCGPWLSCARRCGASEKNRTRAPEPRRTVRRVTSGGGSMVMAITSESGRSSLALVQGAADGAQNAHVRAAPTQVRLHVLADLSVGRVAALLDKGIGAHHHARNAVAALGGLLLKKSPLQSTRLVAGSEALQGRDLPVFDERHRRETREDRRPVDHHGAGAALAQAAAELGGMELQLIAEHVEERRVAFDIDLMLRPVDVQSDHGSPHHGRADFGLIAGVANGAGGIGPRLLVGVASA